MVNAKNVAFKVNKQTPFSQTIAGAYGTVINCRKKRNNKTSHHPEEVRSHHVPLANVPGTLKRKRGQQERHDAAHSTVFDTAPAANTPPAASGPGDCILLNQQWQQRKLPRMRKGKVPLKGVDMDCWFAILSFSDPAQLLELRSKIASCYRLVRDFPMLWKHSRNYYYGASLPEPPSHLTEFEYAHLRHGHGCMSCRSPNTRKTYWAFLRRWCKTCLVTKTIKEMDALLMLRNADLATHGDEMALLQKTLPSGISDSWGNFVGVGPAHTHSLKTVYVLSDVEKLIASLAQARPEASAEPTWQKQQTDYVEARKVFAKKMELWEESSRSSRSLDYQAKKAARKVYFEFKARQLHPPITLQEMECCPSFRRAIAIPKDPNNTSWFQLKPKLEKEIRDMAVIMSAADAHGNTAPLTGASTPNGPRNVSYPHPVMHMF